MRIAILTFHRAFNCGAMLQAWALQTVLERMGHRVEFPDCNAVGVDVVRWPDEIFNDGLLRGIRHLLGWFVGRMRTFGLPTVRRLSYGSFLRRFLNHVATGDLTLSDYDCIVVGSDQVWNPRLMSKDDYMVFKCDHLAKGHNCIGYAISAGDPPGIEGDRESLSHVAKEKFTRISYREEWLRDWIGVAGPVVCDPTFLLGREDYVPIELRGPIVKGDYLFAFAVSDIEETLAKAKEIAKQLNVKLVACNTFPMTWKTNASVKNDCWTISPSKMVTYIRDAKFVVTSSFHGCVFSILYHKQFVCLSGVADSQKKTGRKQDVLRKLGILNRRMSCADPSGKIIELLKRDYHVDDQLQMMRREGLEFLKEALCQ